MFQTSWHLLHRLSTLHLLNSIMTTGGRFFREPLSRHNHKQVSEVCLHMDQNFPHNRDPLIPSSCFVSWCHNRDRKYSSPFLQHFAVRTSQRYDPASWSSRPLWWNAVIQDICEAKGSWTPWSYSHTQCVCAYMFGYSVLWKGVNQLAF